MSARPSPRKSVLKRDLHRARMLEQDAAALQRRLEKHKHHYGGGSALIVTIQAGELTRAAKRMADQLQHEIEYGRFP